MQDIWDWIVGWGQKNLTDFTAIKLYIACAVAGGTVLIGQTGLNLFGLGGDTDVDPDVDVDDIEGGDSLSFLSIRALAGFLTFFGLVGWLGISREWGSAPSALAAFAAGSTVMVLIAFMMRSFKRLASSGNLRPQRAVGRTARVYLRIPGENQGRGKITLELQGRSAEFEAVTKGPELPSGSECKIVAMISESTFEVASLD